MPNRLISFDFGGTLAERDFFGINEWEQLFADTADAVRRAKKANSDLYFSIATNGSIKNPQNFVQRLGLGECFISPAGKSLIIASFTTVERVKTVQMPVKQTIRERLRKEPIKTEPVQKTHDYYISPKPAPNSIAYAMDLCEIEDAAQVVHIGDDYEDEMLAKYSGIGFVGIGILCFSYEPESLSQLIDTAMQKIA